jgi:hypothetical protein
VKTSHFWAPQNQPGDKSLVRTILSTLFLNREEASRGSRGWQ